MQLNKYQLINGIVYYDRILRKMNVGINNGIITYLGDEILDNYDLIDCRNRLITLGFIDTHVHFRSPGYSYKEDLVTGSRAALKGGYMHVCTMPNTKPCLDNYKDLKYYLRQANIKSDIFIHSFSAITLNQEGRDLVDIENISTLGICGYSDDGKGLQDGSMMKQVLIETGEFNHLVSAHCEDETTYQDGQGCIGVGKTASEHNLKTISNACESNMIDRDLKVISHIHGIYNYHYHVCHISTMQSLKLIEAAKAKGYNVSCEVTPHHLISDESEIDINNTNYKMNPPLRSRNDVDYLVEGLRNGHIDIIATDHAPHTKEDKDVPFDEAPFGIIGLEMAFSLLNTYLIKSGKVPLVKILECLIDNPSNIFNIEHRLAVGEHAFLNIIDLDCDVMYTENDLASKSCNTFYLNRALKGKVIMNIVKRKQFYW
ncbi:MAG: dihydroorotase [Bacilli bacterium]|jgi:dihydroorotase|nr:dihydroorotase [Bacilli bacterium]